MVEVGDVKNAQLGSMGMTTNHVLNTIENGGKSIMQRIAKLRSSTGVSTASNLMASPLNGTTRNLLSKTAGVRYAEERMNLVANLPSIITTNAAISREVKGLVTAAAVGFYVIVATSLSNALNLATHGFTRPNLIWSGIA